MAAALAGFESAVTAGSSRAAGGSSSMMQGYGVAGAAAAPGSSATIDAYYLSRHCAVCDELTRAAEPLCERCRECPQVAAVVLAARAARLERQHQHLVRLCQSCGGGGGWNVRHGGVVCGSLDCGVYYERYKVVGEMRSMSAVAAAGLQLL
jgi:DNA polymerase zeta